MYFLTLMYYVHKKHTLW